MSYRDRSGRDVERGSAINLSLIEGEIVIELGVMRNFGSILADAWSGLTPDEAREIATDLINLAVEADRRAQAMAGANVVSLAERRRPANC